MNNLMITIQINTVYRQNYGNNSKRKGVLLIILTPAITITNGQFKNEGNG